MTETVNRHPSRAWYNATPLLFGVIWVTSV